MPCPGGQESYSRHRAWLEGQAGGVASCLRSLSQDEQMIFRLAASALSNSMRSSSAYAETGCIPSAAAGAQRAYVRILNKLCLLPQTEGELKECENEIRDLERRPEACPEPPPCPPQRTCPEPPPCPTCPEPEPRAAPPVRRPEGASWGVTIGAAVAAGMVGYVAARAMR